MCKFFKLKQTITKLLDLKQQLASSWSILKHRTCEGLNQLSCHVCCVSLHSHHAFKITHLSLKLPRRVQTGTLSFRILFIQLSSCSSNAAPKSRIKSGLGRPAHRLSIEQKANKFLLLVLLGKSVSKNRAMKGTECVSQFSGIFIGPQE